MKPKHSLSYYDAHNTCVTQQPDEYESISIPFDKVAKKLTELAWPNSTKDIIFEVSIRNDNGSCVFFTASIDIVISFINTCEIQSQIGITEILMDEHNKDHGSYNFSAEINL